MSALDANSLLSGNQSFNWLGDSAFTGRAGEARGTMSGLMTEIQFDTNADKLADMTVWVLGNQPLAQPDFIL